MSENRRETLIEQLERALGVQAGTALAEEMRHHLIQLHDTDDLNWIDLMVWRLTEEGVPLPTVIQDLAARAAYLRLNGAGTRSGKATKVLRQFAKSVAHANSAFLQGLNGVGAEEADLRAVVSVEEELGYAPKASSLSQERPSSQKERPVLETLTDVGRAFVEAFPELAAAMADHTRLLAKEAKKDKKDKKPNKVGTRR